MINATLFLQMINFAIAYVIIEKLFFKPFVTDILKKNKHKQSLQEEYASLLKQEEAYKVQKKNLWTENRRRFTERIPQETHQKNSCLSLNIEGIKSSLFKESDTEKPVCDQRDAIRACILEKVLR